MENSAKIFLTRDVQDSLRKVQKSFFDIVDDLKATDLDNCEQLKAILKDDNLANAFLIFHENRSKAIRKKILDIMGEEGRELLAKLDDYNVSFDGETEIKGIIK